MFSIIKKVGFTLMTLLSLLASSGSINSFAQGDDPTQGRPTVGVVYMHTNHLGSTTLTTDDQGQVKARFVYEPYGSLFRGACEGPDDVRPKFSGKERDADTELYYFEARYYDAQSGRFVSADNQAGAAINHPMAFHRYAYSANNPINITDPSGRSLKDKMLPDDDKAMIGITSGLKGKHLPAEDLVTHGPVPPPMTIEQAILISNAPQLIATPAREEEDTAVACETVVMGPLRRGTIAVFNAGLDALAALSSATSDYESEISVSSPLPVMTPLGVTQEVAYSNSEDHASVQTVWSAGISGGAGLTGGGSIAQKVDLQTGASWLEITLEGGAGGGVTINDFGAEVVVIGVEGKVIIPLDGGEIDFDAAMVHSATLGPATFKLSNSFKDTITHYYQVELPRVAQRSQDMPPAWAKSHYTLEQYQATVEYHLRGKPFVTIDGHSVPVGRAIYALERVNTYPSTTYEEYQDASNATSYQSPQTISLSGGTFDQSQGANNE